MVKSEPYMHHWPVSMQQANIRVKDPDSDPKDPSLNKNPDLNAFLQSNPGPKPDMDTNRGGHRISARKGGQDFL